MDPNGQIVAGVLQGGFQQNKTNNHAMSVLLVIIRTKDLRLMIASFTLIVVQVVDEENMELQQKLTMKLKGVKTALEGNILKLKALHHLITVQDVPKVVGVQLRAYKKNHCVIIAELESMVLMLLEHLPLVPAKTVKLANTLNL